jgi:hypothetical protein
LPLRALAFEPLFLPAFQVVPFRFLGNDAFKTHRTGFLKHRCAVAEHMIAVKQRLAFIAFWEQGFQLFLSLHQRQLPQILAIQFQKVEHVGDDFFRMASFAECRL